MTRHHALSSAYVILFIITALGGYLRFSQLGNPLWIDEVLFIDYLDFRQEQIPRLLLSIFNGEWVRLPYALAGTLMIPIAFFAVLEDDVSPALCVALFVAVFPLFVFWSTLARPYILGAMFAALGWRWRGGYILALLCTPLAILGFHIKDWKWIAVGVVICFGLFALRPDTDRSFLDPDFLINARRIYVPLVLGAVLHIGLYCGRILAVKD